MAQVRKLPVASSLYLDLIRFAAALMVVCGHLTQDYFSAGWRDHTTLAVNAVGVFFVLSGFVIRYVTRLKYHRIGEYWIDRAARIYSVVLPAIAFTLVADGLARFVNPLYYLGNWSGNIDHPVTRLLTNLTFTSQVWSHSIALFSNGPFWSLSYECFYYVLYGCAFYLTGMRRIASFVFVAGLAGPHILLLLPLWLLGCVVFDVYEKLRSLTLPKWIVHSLLALIGIAGFLLRDSTFATLFNLKTVLARLFLAHHHRPINLHWTLDYYSVGIPAAFLLLWSLVWMENLRDPQPSFTTKSIRTLADGTFPLYLFHFPFFVLVAAVIPYDHHNQWFKFGIAAMALVLSTALAMPTNLFKNYLRAQMQKRFLPARSAQKANATASTV